MAETNSTKLGKSVLAAVVVVCVNTFACLVIEARWREFVLRRGLTMGYYNSMNNPAEVVAYTLLGLVVAAVIGLPLQALMQRWGVIRWYWYSLVGGSGIAAMAWISNILTHYQRHPILVCGIGFGLGFLASTIFWLIRRPDRDTSTEVSA